MKEVLAMPHFNFECEHFFLNAHLIRELTRTHETTEQIWTEMMLGVLKWDWRIPFDSSSGTSSANVRVSFLYIKKRKKVTKRFDMKEKFYIKNKLEE